MIPTEGREFGVVEFGVGGQPGDLRLPGLSPGPKGAGSDLRDKPF